MKKKNKLIDQAKTILERLSNSGWQQLFLQHGLDILSPDLGSELLKELHIDRTQPGIEDFSQNGIRAIEPCNPASSLLFHAMASPQVISYKDNHNNEVELSLFPTFEEICTIENLVYGIKPPSIHDLRIKAGIGTLGIVTFFSEYRPAIETVHQYHADKCFSRVGISRVGTEEISYNPKTRSHIPEHTDPFKIRVIPAYFSAYIAVKLQGNKKNFGPMGYIDHKKKYQEIEGQSVLIESKSDSERSFWVPLHKLFIGTECIRGYNLNINFEGTHINEKLRRVHRALSGQGHNKGYNTGKNEPELSNYPFVIRDGIADLHLFYNNSEGYILPRHHSSIVELAKDKEGNIITFKVPEGKKPFRSSIIINSKSTGARSAPEYVYARHKVLDNKIINLNKLDNMLEVIEKGGYDAAHYIDYSGEGFIEANCNELALEIPETIPAYSMVSATDYFPHVKQHDLIKWWQQSVPSDFYNSIWPSNPGPPNSLSDVRYPANLALSYEKLKIKDRPKEKFIFDKQDDTIASVVSNLLTAERIQCTINPPQYNRTTFLPDGASGVFAPGWDVSIDRTDEYDPNDNGDIIFPGTTYFNNYGLGSPFPEDAMLCAALSSFWPAAAPDITRSFAPSRYSSSTPLTDDVIGMETDAPWNEIPPPKIVDTQNAIAEVHKIEYGDFVETALQNKFNYKLIFGIDAKEYVARTFILDLAYRYLGAKLREEKAALWVFSFKKVTDFNLDKKSLQENSIDVGNINFDLNYLYRIEIYNHQKLDEKLLKALSPKIQIKFDKSYFRLSEKHIFYASPKLILVFNDDDKWKICRY